MIPECYAIITADKVFREDNGKLGVIGIFDNFNFPAVPAKAPPWYIFIGLSNIPEGEYDFSINLVHNETTSVVLPISGSLPIKNNKMISQITMPVPEILFPRFGKYTLTVNINGSQVASKTLTVNQITR